MQNRKLTRILRVLTNPSLLKGALIVRVKPYLHRLLEKLLPQALYFRLKQLETDMSEASFRLLQLEAHEHLTRVGFRAPLRCNRSPSGQAKSSV